MNLKRLVIGTRLERPARILHGLVTMRTWRPAPSEWERRDARDAACIRDLLKKILKRDSNCIDIGAHGGCFLRLFLEFAPEGRHLAFEPIPSLAAELRRHFPAVEIHECALSDQEGQAEFQYIPELPGWSGLRPQPYPVDVHPQTIPVIRRRLDDVVREDLSVAFIKIDVEGAEWEVLRGAVEVLRSQKPVVLFECGKIHHTYYETEPRALHEWLAACGMGVFLLDLTGPLTADEFVDIYEASHRSGYDRNAHGNYLAMPNVPGSK